jgi:hemolysin activation/secretion protein
MIDEQRGNLMPDNAFRFAYIALAGASFFTPVSVVAQSNNAPTRDELESKKLPDIEVQRSRLKVDGDIERAPCPLADPAYANVQISFSQVEFTGLSGIDPASLDSSWRDVAGKTLPIAQLCEIRDRAATTLRRAGYLAAVQVMPQRIAPGGTLKFDVLLAKLVKVQVRGDAGPSEGRLVAFLNSLTGQNVFNFIDAERAMLLARDIPGYDVRMTLRPAGTVPGEVIGEVAVTYRRFELEANIQNLGSVDTGRFGGLLGARINGLTGLGDQTTLSIFNTVDSKEQTILQAGHSFLIGNNGLRVSADVTHAWSSPALNPPAPIKSKTLIASISASYPVIRSQSKNLVVSAGFDWIDQETRFGTTPLTQDKLRIAYGRVDFDARDPASLSSAKGYSGAEPHWRIGGSAELRQGIGGLGASPACGTGFSRCLPPFTPLSRIEADTSGFVARGQAYIEYRPIPDVTLSMSMRGQFAPKPLTSYEEFSAGNYTVGRGYDAGVLLGDSGLGSQTELRLFSLQPKSIKDLALQPFAFFDAARVWNKDILTAPYAHDKTHLYSVGGGVRAALGKSARLDLTAAAPLRTAGLLSRKGDVRFLMSLTVKLIPWSL